jgi:hypothetical protein
LVTSRYPWISETSTAPNGPPAPTHSKLERHASGTLHAEHVGDAERLHLAFETLDRYAAVERLLK